MPQPDCCLAVAGACPDHPLNLPPWACLAPGHKLILGVSQYPYPPSHLLVPHHILDECRFVGHLPQRCPDGKPAPP